MPTYKVHMMQTVVEECRVEVDAKSKKQAQTIAASMGNRGEVSWDFFEAPSPIEVLSCEVKQ